MLFPGVDPTVWVEELGREFSVTQENGRFMNISMGQGQEAPAEAAVQKFAKEGGWIMLQVLYPARVATSVRFSLGPPSLAVGRRRVFGAAASPFSDLSRYGFVNAVALQNVHLMQSWLPKLERLLETCVETADAEFRCFISAEPAPLPSLPNCPESLLQVLVTLCLVLQRGYAGWSLTIGVCGVDGTLSASFTLLVCVGVPFTVVH